MTTRPRRVSLLEWRYALASHLSADSETAALDAQVLLAHALGRPRTWVLAHPEAPLEASQVAHLEELLAALVAGSPLPYVLGHQEFYGLDFQVTPQVLIPRPETELLVEQALQWLTPDNDQWREKDSAHSNPSRSIWVADIGTGSGCIAVSLAVHLPDIEVLASDVSRPALIVARHNARQHHVADRIHLVQADLLAPFAHAHDRRADRIFPHRPVFALICANLPYIPTSHLRTLKVFGREPSLALDGGPDGFVLIKALLTQASQRLMPGGRILLEIEASQGQAVHQLAQKYMPQADLQIISDLAGRDRLLCIQTGPAPTQIVPSLPAYHLV